MSRLMQDVRFALRRLRRSVGFAVVVVLSFVGLFTPRSLEDGAWND